ncbi:MAG: saccharopine dehydrogenase NADP-binding domain-containing protein [Bacteroidia bacterium]|nr:saccharopine dehydrogenase NADP-binding domain-containing protein [Bacteroidia bacterium]MCF8425708.1 saccharopine dehydrogenase NADP-binding domain-containing protein [Bacteroidia bacterium]MCF8446786.1 saccharopine dehydrogenase NADP-binding domain-containing protein [Bacteroidia bacterium]
MKNILVLGAGLSSSYLIKYLLQHAKKEDWKIIVADSNLELAQKKIGKSTFGKAVEMDIHNQEKRQELIKNSDLVISMLPATLHFIAAQDCILYQKHLITASYLSEEMKSLHTQALKANVLFLNEIGLDPGIDHLSAMKMIHHIQSEGGEIVSFESYCGGLVAPEFDDNPWNYKFTWNPRNVVLAGQATARYLEAGLLKFIPPNRIFSQTKKIKVGKNNTFESYANRDSLSYIDPYGIGSAQTVLRGTLRKVGFSEAWNCLVKLGLTDDSYSLPQTETLTYRELMSAFIGGANSENLEKKLADFLGLTKASKLYKKILWLGLLETNAIGMHNATPAQALQKLLQEKWKLQKGELDQIVMKHEISYKLNGKIYYENASLIVNGENQQLTSMAKTVGLPMAIAAKLLLQGKIKARGVQIPITKEFYEPILLELEKYGVKFI